MKTELGLDLTEEGGEGPGTQGCFDEKEVVTIGAETAALLAVCVYLLARGPCYSMVESARA